MTSAEPAVLTEGLGRMFGDTAAVTELDLEVAPGSTFGFLGPNGAGKTTTIAMLATLLRPTAGTATVAGHDIGTEPGKVRERIGLVFQESTLDQDLTAEETLRFHGELFGFSWRQSRHAAGRVLDLTGLADRRGEPVQHFSGGMRRRLEIARGLLTTPRVLFLDEPTTGLDPQTRLAIWEYLHQLRRESRITLFLTTHHLEEAEHCDRLAIMDEGFVVAEGSPGELKSVVGADLVELRTADDPGAAALVNDRFGLPAEVVDGGGVRVRARDGAAFVPAFCRDAGIPVHAVTVTPPSLDDVFVHYTGHTIRDQPTGPRTLDTLARRSS